MTTNSVDEQQQDRVTFGLRWLIPVAVLVNGVFLPGVGGTQTPNFASMLVIVAVVGVYNFAVFLGAFKLLPARARHVAIVVADSLLAIIVITIAGPSLIWVGLLPVILAGLRIGWQAGLMAAGAVIVGSLIGLVISNETLPSPEAFSPLIVAVFLFPVAALVTGMYVQGSGSNGKQRSADTDRQLQQAQGQMKILYEMASTLSSSLNHQRVLEMIMDVGVLGLQRMGVGTHLSSAVLLFTDTEHDDETVLRVAAERRLTHADVKALVPGAQGVIGDALRTSEPAVTYDAHDDPELKYFSAFRNAEVVLCIPMLASFDNYGVLVFANPEQRGFESNHIEFMQALANQATAALQNAKLYQDLAEEKNRIIDVDEEARKQLARDLHDGPTQTVSGIAMRASLIRRMLDDKPEQIPEEIEKIEELARLAASEIRHMLFTLRPLALEAQGLVAALEQLAGKMHDTYQQNVTVQAEPTVETHLDSHAQGSIFYIVEEAANNARKHAQAETVSIALSVKSDVVLVEISDNGKGFDIEAVNEEYENRGSLGMVNLRERTELLDGSLHIESALGKGTRISLLVPLERAQTGKLAAAEAQST